MATEELRRVPTFVGATGRKIRLQMRDQSTGAAYDLTGFSSATVSARFSGDSTYKIQAADMTIEVGADGWVYFYPKAAEVDIAGDLRAQVRIIGPDGPDFSQKFILVIEEPEHYV